MTTSKPQLKVYLPQNVYDEIQQESEKTGIKLGDLVERMWQIFTLKDFNLLADKIQKYVNNHPFESGKSPVGLVRIGMILNAWIKK